MHTTSGNLLDKNLCKNYTLRNFIINEIRANLICISRGNNQDLLSQIRSIMASLGITKFQDLIGRTDLLKVRSDLKFEKARTLDLSMLLRNALELRPGVNIKGGSVKQDFQLEQRPENVLIEKVAPILNGQEKSLTIEMTINNETRAFGSTLSYHISKYV